MSDKTDFDVVNAINTILPFEKHLPGMNFCGPGTNLKKKLNADYSLKDPKYKPIDRIDEAAMKHDIKYSKYDDLRKRHEADKEMIREVLNINNPTWRERLERGVVLIILGFKALVGSCILKVTSFNTR